MVFVLFFRIDSNFSGKLHFRGAVVNGRDALWCKPDVWLQRRLVAVPKFLSILCCTFSTVIPVGLISALLH